MLAFVVVVVVYSPLLSFVLFFVCTYLTRVLYCSSSDTLFAFKSLIRVVLSMQSRFSDALKFTNKTRYILVWKLIVQYVDPPPLFLHPHT